MRLLTSLRDVSRPEHRRDLDGAAVGVTIGNFDGMHRGHQALFAELREETAAEAEALGKPSRTMLFTFAPHPRQVLGRIARRTDAGASVPEEKRRQITPPRHKLLLARQYGFDYVFLKRFTPSFAACTPHEFVDRYLIQALGVCVVVVGYDWSFGQGRAGSSDTLAREGAARGFKVLVVPPVSLQGDRVSSSLVREAISAGALSRLSELLGRRFSIIGKVIQGDERGRTLGFPTANIACGEMLLPPNGVYAVTARIDGKAHPAVCNIGVRPTFDGSKRLLEVHVLDASDLQLYGKWLEVEFISLIREERRFPGPEQLQAQIAADIAVARKHLGSDGVRETL
ncbi:MAG: riboflavin biosynthesis protein RibF [Bdellovibrionales bacterium]|nr:riboflavin biosynthesis protein RibF [Bdellovibrionales bacterium]